MKPTKKHIIKNQDVVLQPSVLTTIPQILLKNGIWYKGADIAKKLGYDNPSKAIYDHVLTNDKMMFTTLMKAGGREMIKCPGDVHGTVKAYYINIEGVHRLACKCQLPGANSFIEALGITQNTRYLRKETEIVGFIQEVLTEMKEPFEFQKKVGPYKIDLYLTKYNIAIEIDEHGHTDRCVVAEINRENFIKSNLKCTILRFNPDEPDFKISKCLGRIISTMQLR
jgi:very-short-patch-repair endonuclease